MPAFNFVVANLKSAFDTYVTDTVAVYAAQADIDGLGPRPEHNTNIVVTSADWNDVTTAQIDWDSQFATYNAVLLAAVNAQRSTEHIVLNRLCQPNGTNLIGPCVDQWVKLVGAGAGPLTYTVWVGTPKDSLYLTISQVEPSQPFPYV